MEQARYWMWTRRYTERPLVGAQMPPALAVRDSSYKETWEEQAFAEDAAGNLGGCVWPPRSYTCSFCRREFRSAQALGGHMNVHRRDRARLKQSSSPTSESLEDQEHSNPCTATVTQYQQQVASLVYGTTTTNPKPNASVVESTISHAMHARSTPDNWSEIPVLSSSFSLSSNSANKKQEPQLYAVAGSSKDAITSELHMIPELKLGRELNLASKVEPCGIRRRREPDEDDVVNDLICSKRRRTDAIKFSVMEQHSSVTDHLKTLQSQVIGPKPVEEIDLELRLGDAQKS